MQKENMMAQANNLKVGYQADILQNHDDFSNLSISMDSNKVFDTEHKNNNNGIAKQPAEAPTAEKAKISEFNDNLMSVDPKNNLLGTKKPPDFSMKQELKINSMLGSRVKVDTIHK